MGKGSQFSEFTYGVGLEITAQSFKQVKDDLKLNLDNLSKMVKSYGKVLKIDPDADLSKLFDGMKQLQGIINGINSSNNSFSGFVDKGTLGSMAALETRLSDIDSTSDRVNAQLTELKGVISQLIEPLKAAGEIKFPATFENLFGNFEDQTAKIKSVSDSIATLRNSITELQKISSSASDIYSDMSAKGSKLDDKSIERLVSKFWDVRNQLSNISDLDPSKAKAAVAQIKDIGLQLASAIKGFSTDQLLDKFGIDDAIVVTEIDELIKTIQSKKDALATELSGLKDLQAKFVENQKAATPSKAASLGLQSDVTAQVKVTPKTNDTEWANTINDTIKNIEPLLNKVRLIPTFSKSKNISKEMEGNLSQINHAVNVELKVDHNIEKFNEQINNIDTSIKNAKQRLEKNGNFRIKFEYEEGGNFRDVAYKIINQLKQVEVHVDAKTSANFIKELGSLRTKANKELKNISATIKTPSTKAISKSVETLRSDVDSKIGNIDINLNIKNEPQIIAQATLIRDKLVDLYNNIPVNLSPGTIAPNTTMNTPSGETEQLSDAARAAKEDLERCRQILASLQTKGFNAPEFLQLGNITPDGKKIKDSEKHLNDLLNKYKELKAKFPDDVANRWQELYPEANGDKSTAAKMAKQVSIELKQVEDELNQYLQKQIAYTQNRYDNNQKILQQEKEIASVQHSSVDNATKSVNSERTKKIQNELTLINNLIKDLQVNGFKSSEFLNLGDIGADGNKIEETTKKLKRLATEYNKLKQRVTPIKGGGQKQWLEKYPKANGDQKKIQHSIEKDEKRIKTIESELNQYVQKQLAFLSSRKDSLQQILSAEEKITSEHVKQTQTNNAENSNIKSNEKLAMSAEEASKKIRSMTSTITHQKKTLQDLKENGINSSAFMKVGEWDKQTNSFKKFSNETLQLISRYKELRQAREQAGGKKAVGEEAQLRGKLSAILREQKKHASEILSLNQQELEAARAIASAHKGVDASGGKSSSKKTVTDIATIEKNVEELTEKLNKARSALSSLKSDGIGAVGATGLKDTKGVLRGAGVTQGLKATVALYNELLAKKKEIETGGGISQSVSQINAQIDKLMNARKLLSSKGFFGLADTQIGDVKGRLGSDPQALNTLISQYKQLSIAKKEFEKSGDTTSESYIQTSKALDGATQQLKILHQDQLQEIDARIQGLQTEASKRTEYVKIVQECKTIEDLLVEVHKNQVEYAQSRVELYSKQLTKAQELLQVEQQRAQMAVQQSGVKPNAEQSASTVSSSETTPHANTEQTAGIVKLDSSTLSSLAKDGTLKSIDGKVGNILSQLGNGINITGSNISIEASNVSVTGGNTKVGSNANSEKSDNQSSTSANNPVVSQTNVNQQLTASAENAINKQKELKAEIKQTQEQTEYMLSSTVNLVREVNGEIAASSDIYKTADKVEEKTEKWGWVSHGKEEPPTFEHISTVYKTNNEAYNRLYQSFIDALAKQKQIEQQIAATNGPTAKLQAELEIQKEITASLEAQLQSHDKLYTEEAKRVAMTEATKKAQQELAKITGAQSDKDVRKQNVDLMRIVDNAQKKYMDMQYTMSNFKVPMADSAIAKFKEYEQLLTTLKTKQQEINANPTLLQNKNYSNNFVSLLQQMKSVESEFFVLQKSSEEFLSNIRSIDDIKPLGSTFDPNNLEQMHDEMYAFANQVSIGKAKLIEFNDAERTATFEIKNGKGQVQQLTVAYDSATNSLGRYTTKTKESVSETQKFISSLKHSFKNVARYLASFGSVYRIFAVIKQGFTYIKDIDSALTELKKVTDETDASYAKFLQDMSNTGKVVGATVKDLTTMAAEWARLGYSMQEAGKLAESTAVLLNVSEFEDATKASEALISTMQAFKYTADESGHVVDILNEIGNNYAVSSDGIATALQDSASALMEGGNNLEQAVALVAAANRVVQDPNSVGSALRTISLRLRGTSVKILEEMGEETEGVVESVSKLQKKIQALSGVNILTDAGDYKDTYTILKEIGNVWEDMSDIDQAALLELMAGKNRANTLSAILSNMTDLENAYEDALDAEGSALRENEAYLDSIQGRIDLFNNSVQTMWMNMINSETVKGFVDIGTGLINIIDKLELIPTLLLTILSYKSMFSKNKWDFASMLGIHALDDNFKKGFSIFGNAGLTGWVANKFKGKNNLANVVLGNPNDIKLSVADFADAIQNNINDYVTIDTSRIDSEIQDVQNKLYVARQQLDTARKADWNYYKSFGSITPAKDRDNRILEQRQQIKTLESDLAALQARRDSMVSSAVNTTAQSMVGVINNETQAYKSMLSVLDQIQGKKLYIGNELNAATKIDAMSAAAKQGQTQLVNYVSTLGDADIALKAYAASVKDGNYSLAGFQDFVAQHNAQLKASGAAAKAAAFGHQLLNAALSVGISLLISGAIRLISNWTNAAKKAAEAARDAADASKSIGEQADSLEDYKEQIKDLRKELDSNTLSESDAYDAREKLLDIQKELIEKFGLEKDGINLVTGAINNQIAAIDELSRKEAQEWLNSNQKEINNAIEYFDSDIKGGSLDPWYEGPGTRIDMWGQTQNVIDMIDEYASQHDHISTNQAALIPGDQSISFTGSVEEVKKEVEDFQSWLETKENELLKQKTDLLAIPDQTDEIKSQIASIEKDIEQLQDVREDLGAEYKNWFGENSAYASNQALIEETQRNTAITQYADQYMKILQAENDLVEAQAKGDKEGVAAAIEIINAETAAAAETANANGQNYMVNFFNGIKEGYETQSKELNLELDLANNVSSKSSLLGILSLFKDKNAKEILQDYEIDPNTDAFQKLDTFAKQYDMTVEELIASLVNLNYIQSGFAADVEDAGLAFKSYSELADGVESYNEVLSKTYEIISDNTEVTQEYKDSLKDLGITEEELNECFDKDNKLIVRNAALLRKLVEQKRQEKKATVQQAKSQNQLQYKNTVQQLQQLIKAMALEAKATGVVSNVTLNAVDVLRSQLTTLKQTIQQYALLELQLSDAANAYSEFEAAKERDAQLTYGDSMIEALQTINDGFKTGQVGTEAFQAAVGIVVPPEVYQDIDDVEARMIAIHDYIDKNPLFADWFTIDEGEFSITLDNINNFIDDAFGAGLFTNDSSGNFFLTDEIKNAKEPLKEFADQLGEAFGTEVTEGSVLAMLTELEKYDASWGNVITDLTTFKLDREIMNATDALDEALIAQEEFIRSGGNLNSDEYKQLVTNVEAAQTALNNATKAAEENAQQYSQIETAYAALTGNIKLTKEAADSLFKSLGFVDANGNVTVQVDDDGTIHMTEEQLNTLKEKADEITSQPTIMDMQLRYDNIDAQIAELQKYIDEDLNFADSQIAVSFGITNEEEAKAKVAELTAEQETISLNYNITATTAEQTSGTLEKLTTWETNGLNINISGNTEELKAAVDEANGLEVDDKEPKIIIQGVPVAISAIDSVASALDKLKDTSIDVSVNKTTYEQTKKWNSSTQSYEPMANGTAHAGGNWGAPETEVALTGELGPEMIVRGNKWFTVGDNGAEFTQVKKGDIIFNHKQTEDLLSKGYVTGRGKLKGGAFASGTAYYRTFGGYVGDNDVFENGSDKLVDPYTNISDSLSDAADALSDAADSADEFNEVFDWIEVRLEELEETLSLLDAKLANAVYYNEKNNIIDNMINVNKTKLANLNAGYEEYEDYAASLLTKVPEQYREAAKNGAIAIEKFVGEADEATLEAINNYREWIQKAADLKQQAEEIMTTIRDLAIQKFDNAYEAGDVRATVEDSQTEKLQNQVDLLETMGEIASEVYYGINGGNADNSTGMFENAYKKIEYLTEARKAMQAELNEAVEAGQIQRGSNEWYELIDQMYQIESQIHEANVELEEFQNAINDIYWDNFDQLINRLGYLKDETQNLIDLMDSDDMVVDPQKRRYEGGTVEYWTKDDVKWSDEGLASLGLYAQQMEIAEYTARQYAEAIDDLEKEYKAGHYSENEYVEKLNELKDAQYENIEAYYDAQEAIKDLNETRIDSIKEGIEKEIEAYEELIEKKKEELDAEKDLYDFQKDTMDQQKNIANIERQLAALANDNSMSAIARRKQLEAELAEAQYQLQDTYYNRSVEDKQTALDQELEKFQTEKDAEITKWEEYLTNVEQVVADSLLTIQSNATGIYDTLMGKAEEYDLTLTDSIMTPWQNGAFAVSDYQETFDTAMSSTMDQLEALKRKWQEIIDTMAQVGEAKVAAIEKENKTYTAATKKEPPKTQSKPAATTPSKPAQTQKTISVGGMINAAGAKIYGWPGGPGDGQYFSNDPIYTVLAENGEWIQVRHRGHSSGVTGWFKKSDVKPYAKGTTSLAKSGIVNIDELGDELLLRAQNGRLTYMEKGSGIVPADLTSNLMKWGELDPTNMLDQNRPAIGVHPEIHNTEVNISISYGDMVSIGEFHGDNPEDIAKIVAKQFEKHTKDLNNAIRKYSR